MEILEIMFKEIEKDDYCQIFKTGNQSDCEVLNLNI